MNARTLVLAGILTVTSSVALVAQDARSDFEIIDLEPKEREVKARLGLDKGPLLELPSQAPSAADRGNVYERTARRKRSIRAFFQKLKDQVDAVEQLVDGITSDEAASSEPVTAAPAGTEPDSAGAEMPQIPSAAVVGSAESHFPAPSGVSDTGPALAATEGHVYAVRKGDTLEKIARRFYKDGRKYKVIADANGIDPRSIIRIGQKLRIPSLQDIERGEITGGVDLGPGVRRPESTPAPTPTPPAPAPKASAPSSPSGGLDYSSYEFKLYSVEAGDSLDSIARKFYGSGSQTELIRQFNTIKGGLKPGDKILIPLPKKDAMRRRSASGEESF